MSSELTDRFIEALQTCERTGDVTGLSELFSDDADLTSVAARQDATGRDAARQFWREYLSVFRDVRSEFTNVIECGGRAVLEWVSEGTLATGAPVKYRGVSILESAGDRIRHFRTYYDSAPFLPHGARHTG